VSKNVAPIDAINLLISAFQDYRKAPWQAIEVGALDTGFFTDLPVAERDGLQQLSRFFTSEDISNRPDLIKPVVDVLEQLLDPEAGEKDRDFAKEFLKIGYKFVGALSPIAKEFDCVEPISRVFDLIQQRALFHTFDTQGFNPLPSLRLCLAHNLGEMPAPIVSKFMTDGAGYTYGYRYTKTQLKLFLFEHADTFCLVTDLHMNQGLLAVYAHAFGAASGLTLSDEDFLPESQFSGKMLSFCERVKCLVEQGVFIPGAQHVDLLLVAQTLSSISKVYAQTETPAHKSVLEQGAASLMELTVNRHKPMSEDISAFNKFGGLRTGVDVCIENSEMTYLIERMVQSFTGRTETASLLIEKAVGDLKHRLVCEMAVQMKGKYAKSQNGPEMFNKLVNLAPERFQSKADFSSMNNATLAAFAAAVDFGPIKNNLLSHHPKLIKDTFMKDLGL
jgi:hypothetical protein